MTTLLQSIQSLHQNLPGLFTRLEVLEKKYNIEPETLEQKKLDTLEQKKLDTLEQKKLDTLEPKSHKPSKRDKNKDPSFISLSSLTNHYHDKVKDFIIDDKSKKKHIVQEKLDGSNFSIRQGPQGEILFCSRNRVLNGQFHNYESLVPELSVYAQKIFDEFGNGIYIYGELMGCSYMNLPVDRKNSKFQTKVQYTNKLVFITYDIYDNEKGCYINSFTALNALQKAGFLISPILATYDSLEEALNHDEIFSSIIPEFLDPELPKHNMPNLAEGIVIRPLHEEYYYLSDRAVFKKKNPSFQEREKKPKGPKPKKPNHNDFLDEYITEPRWNNVRSKHGDDVSKGEMAQAYVDDVFNEINVDYAGSDDPGKQEILKFLDEPKRVGNYRKHIQCRIGRFLRTIN